MTRATATRLAMTRLTPALSLLPLIAACEVVAVDLVFSPRDIAVWETKQFKGPVEYRVVRQDGREALHAVCTGRGASARYLRREIDLRETPILEWSWRIQGTFSGCDERTKAGDDYPVRVYAVFDGGLLPWRTQAVNYVWASERPKESVWPNAYTAQAKMLALQSGPTPAGEWITERRDLVSDFQTAPRYASSGHPWPGDHDRLRRRWSAHGRLVWRDRAASPLIGSAAADEHLASAPPQVPPDTAPNPSSAPAFIAQVIEQTLPRAPRADRLTSLRDAC